MAAAGIEGGMTIMVETFNHNQRLPVDIVSSASVDYGASARIHKGRLRLPHYTYDVALKVIPHILSEEKEEMIRRELKVIKQLADRSMRHILPFIGTATLGFHTVIVAEFMRNGNMLQYFKRHPHANRQHLLLQVAEAVYWLHDCKGLVHGDIKCENVVINDNGDALLADFGLATLVEQDDSSSTTMSAIRNMTTLRFAAPELFFGYEEKMHARPRSKTTESDVYAFGMLMLQAFTGTRPWPHLRDEALLLQISTRSIHPRPSDTVTLLGLTSAWWSVCLACWEFHPRNRPTMHWVWNELEATRRRERFLIGHTGIVTAAAYLPCGRRIVSACTDETIRIWDVGTGQTVVGPIGSLPDRIRCLAVSPDGVHVAGCTTVDGEIHRWDALSGAPVSLPLVDHTAHVTCFAYSSDGLRIVSGSDSYTLRLWDIPTGEPIGEPLRGHRGALHTVAFSADGSRIVSASADDTIRIWDPATRDLLGTVTGRDDSFRCACYLPNGRYIVSGSKQTSVCLWNAATLQLERIMHGHTGWVDSVAVSPSGKYIASCSDDGTIRIWDAHSGEPVGVPLSEHRDWVCSVAFSPDGKRLLSTSPARTVRLWDLFE